VHILKAIIINILFSLFIFLGFFYQLFVGLERTFLSADYYQELASETDFFVLLHRDIKKSFLEKPALQEDEIFFNALEEVVTPQWIGENVADASQDILMFLEGRKERIETVIDLGSKKDEFEKKLITKMRNMPAAEVREMGIEPGEIESSVKNFLESADLPEEIVLMDFYEKEEFAVARDALPYIRSVRNLFAPLFFLFLVFLIALSFLFYGVLEGIKKVGSTVFVCGLIFYIQVVIIKGSVLPELAEFDSALFLVNQTVGIFLSTSKIFIFSGLFLTIAGFVVKKIKEKKEKKNEAN
jgi:hypothetical protein